MTKKTETAPPETEDAILLASKFMTGDLRDFILDRLKNDTSPIPWPERKEAEQRALIDQVEHACARMVRIAVDIIAADGHKVLRGSLVKVVVKDGIQAQIELMQSDPLRHAFIDHQGRSVMIVLATPEDYEGARKKVDVKPDQGALIPDDDGDL